MQKWISAGFLRVPNTFFELLRLLLAWVHYSRTFAQSSLMADYQSCKIARHLLQQDGWKLQIVKRRRREDSNCAKFSQMSTPSEIEAAASRAATSKQQIKASGITWKRDYKGCMVTIFGSERFGWNAQIDKREPIVLGFTRARAIKYAKELIDEEQAKYHSRSTCGASRNGKALSRSKRPNNSFPAVISADRRRG
jgi:hypothetical protein